MMTLHWIELHGAPIFEQLQLEEALLRADDRNFCIVNIGSPRAIVLGLTAKPEELLDTKRVRCHQIPLIQRCSGGGTVIVDENTLFVSFLFSRNDLAFPEPIMRYLAEIYQKAWRLPGFTLCENDFTIEGKKCGGNAQYLRKGRWLHHTSFLFDYRQENMDFLHLPPKRPAYRKDRPHAEFLCRLKDFGRSPAGLITDLKNELVKRLYITDLPPRDLTAVLQREHRKTTHLC